MELNQREEGAVTIIAVGGEVDLYNAPELKEKIQQLVEEKKLKVVINLDRVSYVDSSGIGALISSFSNLKKHDGKMRICHVTGSVRKVFELTKLTTFFDIDGTEQDSIVAINEV